MSDDSEDRLQIIVVDSLGPVYANNVLRLLTTDNGLYYSKNGVYTLIGATGAAHAASHQNGGSDEISVTGLAGLLADPQSVNVRKNSAGSVFQQKQLNLIEGSNVTLTVADDGVTGEVDITIAASGGSSIPVASCRVMRTSNQTIGTSSTTAISFDTESHDDGGLWAIGNPTRLVAPYDGYYYVWCCVRWANNATGRRLLFFKKNGTTDLGPDEGRPGNSVADTTNTMTCGGHFKLAQGDYIECVVNQDSGGNLDLLNSSEFFPLAGMILINVY
jgi:hypothetical protein